MKIYYNNNLLFSTEENLKGIEILERVKDYLQTNNIDVKKISADNTSIDTLLKQDISNYTTEYINQKLQELDEDLADMETELRYVREHF